MLGLRRSSFFAPYHRPGIVRLSSCETRFCVYSVIGIEKGIAYRQRLFEVCLNDSIRYYAINGLEKRNISVGGKKELFRTDGTG